MWRTALLTACLVLAGYAAALWTTHDFQVWTAEGARRLEVALKPVPAPSVEVVGRLFNPYRWRFCCGAAPVCLLRLGR